MTQMPMHKLVRQGCSALHKSIEPYDTWHVILAQLTARIEAYHLPWCHENVPDSKHGSSVHDAFGQVALFTFPFCRKTHQLFQRQPL